MIFEIERLRRELEQKGKPGDLKAGELLLISRRLDEVINRYLLMNFGDKPYAIRNRFSDG